MRPIRIVLASLLLVSACASDRRLDGDLLEAQVAEQLLVEYPGAVRSISCPDAVDPEPGMELLCIASLGAQVLDVNVTIGGTPQDLTATASVDARFVALDEVSALLAATFGDEVGTVTGVECGQPVLALGPMESVVCHATDPQRTTRSFDVLIGDDGLVEVRLR